MNVFVLCTGRCGSTTFSRACSHIENFSSAHESRTNLLGNERLSYPDKHIEVDNRLSWLLGRLDQTYSKNSFYVHLKRDPKEVARSYTRRYSGGIMRAYRYDGIIMGLSDNTDPMSTALDYCETVNANISLFLKDKERKMEFNLENYKEDFSFFWSKINAEGDFERALNEFNNYYNASKNTKKQ